MKPIFPGARRDTIGWLCGLALSLWQAPVGGQEIALQATGLDRVYVAGRSGGSWTVADTTGGVQSLPLAPGARIHSLVVASGGWLAAGDENVGEGGRALLLLRGDARRVRRLPVPDGSRRLLLWPRALVDGGTLVGLAWLEGDELGGLGVRAASWTGRGFAAPVWVSPPRSASQTALAAVVLADGSWLLSWSAFDGEDDEILYSRRVGASWSAPARVHENNRVPDVSSDLAALGSGAVAAWSRYQDGHYVVRISRFRSGEWRGEEAVGGRGSVFPEFVADPTRRGTQLVFPEVAARAWSLLEIDAEGEVTSGSRWPGSVRRRPLVLAGGGGRAALRWLEPAPGDDGEVP